MHGAVDRDDPALGEPGQHAGIAVEDVTDVVVADDAQADQIAGGRQFRRGRGRLRRGVGVRLEAGLPARPQRRLESAVGDPPGHGPALAAQADESDSHVPRLHVVRIAAVCARDAVFEERQHPTVVFTGGQPDAQVVSAVGHLVDRHARCRREQRGDRPQCLRRGLPDAFVVGDTELDRYADPGGQVREIAARPVRGDLRFVGHPRRRQRAGEDLGRIERRRFPQQLPQAGGACRQRGPADDVLGLGAVAQPGAGQFDADDAGLRRGDPQREFTARRMPDEEHARTPVAAGKDLVHRSERGGDAPRRRRRSRAHRPPRCRTPAGPARSR